MKLIMGPDNGDLCHLGTRMDSSGPDNVDLCQLGMRMDSSGPVMNT